jgi:hypothetical protein
LITIEAEVGQSSDDFVVLFGLEGVLIPVVVVALS